MSCSRTQAVARQFQEFAGFRYAAAHETAASGDHGDFSGELARPVSCNQVFACEIRLHDLHSSGKEHVERNVLIAGFEEYVACGDLPRPATGTNAIDLGSGENREGLCAGVERAG
jgi:hypothetical protein